MNKKKSRENAKPYLNNTFFWENLPLFFLKKRGRKGLEMISVAIAVAIVVASTVMVLSVITPTLEQGKAYQSLNKAKQVASSVDAVVRELAYEAPGAKRNVKVQADFGSVEVSGREDKIIFRVDSQVPLFEAGTAVKEGNMLITSGPVMRAYDADVNGDSNVELALENDELLFSMKKIGTPVNWSAINTTTVIPFIKNKLAGVNVTPVAGLFINDLTNTSYGIGYTEITRYGNDIGSSSIRMFMNSTGEYQYEALFSLIAGQDFVTLEIKHIRIV